MSRNQQIPSFDALADNPELLHGLSPAAVAALLPRAAALLAAIGSAMAVAVAKPASVTEPNRTLSLSEAAQMMGVKPSTMRALAATGGKYHALRLDNGTRRLAFSAEKIAAFLDGRSPHRSPRIGRRP